MRKRSEVFAVDPNYVVEEIDKIQVCPTLAVAVVLITPALARFWLNKNHEDNRTISLPSVAAYAGDMSAGNWPLTHESIAFGEGGSLIDGQTRLRSIIQSGKSVRMLVVWNSTGTLHDPMNRGRPRSVGFITGMSYQEVAVCSVLIQLRRGSGRAKTSVTTPGAAMEVANAFQADLKQFFGRVTLSRKLPAGFVAACIWALPVGGEKVLEFAESVACGEMLRRGYPTHTMWRWLEEAKGNHSWPYEMAMATFGPLKAHLQGVAFAHVYKEATTGYRFITAHRRALGIPNTPSATGGDDDVD